MTMCSVKVGEQAAQGLGPPASAEDGELGAATVSPRAAGVPVVIPRPGMLGFRL